MSPLFVLWLLLLFVLYVAFVAFLCLSGGAALVMAGVRRLATANENPRPA